MREGGRGRRKRIAGSNRRKHEFETAEAQKVMRVTEFKVRLILVAFVVSCVFLLGMILYYQLNYGDEYHRRVLERLINRNIGSIDAVIAPPNRGAIMDRNGQVLAAGSIIFDVFIDVRRLVVEEHDVQADSVRKMHEVLDIPEEQLWGYLRVNSDGRPYIDRHHHVIARGVPYVTGHALRELRPLHVHLDGGVMRVYGNDNVASNVIGFIRGENMWGLEGQFNSRLTGVPGRVSYALDFTGNVSVEPAQAVHGNTLITTLDLDLQRVAEQLCEQFGTQFEAANASIIVMNPQTGELYVMAQFPTFNPNEPANIDFINNPFLEQEMRTLSQTEQFGVWENVWANYNVRTTLEIGSVYKSFTVAKALEEGIITTCQRFFCGGSKWFGQTQIPCHTIHRGGCGDQSLAQTIANSCNVAMMEIAEAMGRDIFHSFQVDFGYGVRTGIDLPNESEGVIFSLPRLGRTELATSSFGQRFTATPIQTAVSFAALINGGYVLQPFLVSQVLDERGFVIEENRRTVVRQVISNATSDYLREAMELVITDGTGRRAAVAGRAVAGKTGTAEQGVAETREEQINSWTFAGYYPVYNPRFLVVTIVDRVPYERFRGASSPAVDMFRLMTEAIIDHKNIPPSSNAGNQPGNEPGLAPNDVIVENYVGMPAEQAINAIINAGLELDIIGTGGSVVSIQSILPGTTALRGGVISISFDNSDGRELTPVPNLIGMSLAEANETLFAAGFIPHSAANPYQITNQLPDAGVRLPTGSRVVLR